MLVFPLQPTGPGEVGHQVQTTDIDVEKLSAPGDRGDLGTGQRCRRWIVGFQDIHRDGPHRGDDPADSTLSEEGRKCFYFRKLWHRWTPAKNCELIPIPGRITGSPSDTFPVKS